MELEDAYNKTKHDLEHPEPTHVPSGPEVLRVHDKYPEVYENGGYCRDYITFWKTLSKCTQDWWYYEIKRDRRAGTQEIATADAELCSRLAFAGIKTIEFEWVEPKRKTGIYPGTAYDRGYCCTLFGERASQNLILYEEERRR